MNLKNQMRSAQFSLLALTIVAPCACTPKPPATKEPSVIDLTAEHLAEGKNAARSKLKGYLYTHRGRLWMTGESFSVAQVASLHENGFFPDAAKTLLVTCPFRVSDPGFQYLVIVEGTLNAPVRTSDYYGVISQVSAITLLDQDVYPKPGPDTRGDPNDPFD